MTNTRELTFLEPGVADRRQTEGGEADLPAITTRPTLNQLRRAARRLYGQWFDERQIYIVEKPHTVRHDDPQMGSHGTWIDVSVYVPDVDALEEKP